MTLREALAATDPSPLPLSPLFWRTAYDRYERLGCLIACHAVEGLAVLDMPEAREFVTLMRRVDAGASR